ncbi:TPA: hypothetical protein N0F65_003629 [Lagenidium giganteum]|uniref:Uncharacterized protein n=1 Tax=Lagenidium giganteum TaxID=4803 RepID=A0AAV2YNT1_9STRA|nr:TPA: hypothetical protein N0F65_003629 [Lagenidium giganteum]
MEYVKANNIALGVMLLHIKAEYHHVLNDCDEAWPGDGRRRQCAAALQRSAGHSRSTREYWSDDGRRRHCDLSVSKPAENLLMCSTELKTQDVNKALTNEHVKRTAARSGRRKT